MCLGHVVWDTAIRNPCGIHRFRVKEPVPALVRRLCKHVALGSASHLPQVCSLATFLHPLTCKLGFTCVLCPATLSASSEYHPRCCSPVAVRDAPLALRKGHDNSWNDAMSQGPLCAQLCAQGFLCWPRLTLTPTPRSPSGYHAHVPVQEMDAGRTGKKILLTAALLSRLHRL